MNQFQTIANKSTSVGWQGFCDSVAAEKSLKLFRRLHKTMNCPIKSMGIPNFQHVDLIKEQMRIKYCTAHTFTRSKMVGGIW